MLLEETYEQLDDKIKNEDVSINSHKGIQITLRGNLFQSMKANVNKNYIPVIQKLAKLLKIVDYLILGRQNNILHSSKFLDDRNEELNVEIRCEAYR